MKSHEQVLLDKLRASGLEVIGVAGVVSPPSVGQAWKAVANFEVTPVAKTPLVGAGTAQRLNSLWLEHAEESGVIAEDGSFLVTVVSTGSHEIGWVRVRWTSDADVSRLVDDQEQVEFIGRSLSGHRLVGVTAEEYDYWVVSLPMAPPT
ncbi:hypothetical protein [Streptomyces sp. HB2AG]|uniref:hypothetical protein n=1 Tax=Streptomyces sp. HB2AG TaxID=2983400 RepID=UPI0022AA071A|nr:hypothetical protein [Streptomyces sp. HB2AG]MCZ2525354.1 hypothetical protein [Streptomyces sp. HB2AG]